MEPIDLSQPAADSGATPASPQTQAQAQAQTLTQVSPASGHKKTTSGSGILSKIPFMRSHSDAAVGDNDKEASPSSMPPRPTTSIAHALQQQKTRRRRGSLRKVALLGRGAQRERRESRSLSTDTKPGELRGAGTGILGTDFTASPSGDSHEGLGLGISDITPRPSMDGYASRTAKPASKPPAGAASVLASSMKKPQVEVDEPTPTSPSISYTTTDDEDVLHMASPTPSPLHPEFASLSSGSESYDNSDRRGDTILRRRSVNKTRAKSPLALAGRAATPLQSDDDDDDYDYSETVCWGWVILIGTWLVFVFGMGSVFGVWSWAWDVGTTPYAPPELEDDPTLPITGYYPALIILTPVMALVWVVPSWLGMKYFRHAKISGD